MDPSELSSDYFYLITLAALLVCSMFFSAAETAFISASKLRIHYLREKKNKAAERVERILKKKEFFLNTILIGNNVVNIAASALITALAIRFFGHSGVGIATTAATVIILIFGEILPKSISLLRPEKTALRFSFPVIFLMRLTAPLVAVFTLITLGISHLIGVQNKAARVTVTEEDIKSLIEVGEEEGLIQSPERAMMHKILRYTDLTARDIMIPRTDIVAITIDATRKEILDLAHSSRYSRFPVFGENIDDIKGILYIKDFLFSETAAQEPFSIHDLVRPALFIFESQKMSGIQTQLRLANQNIAIIIDEYGGTAGIVTAENLIEMIFGSLREEYQGHKNESGGIAQIDGSMKLEEINERFGLQLTSGFFDTIGGLIMEKSGNIPEPGLSVIEQGYTFTVCTVSGNRIDTISIEHFGGAK